MSITRLPVGVNEALASGQEAQDALASCVADLVQLAGTSGLREHARAATQVARLVTDLHVILEELAEGGAA